MPSVTRVQIEGVDQIKASLARLGKKGYVAARKAVKAKTEAMIPAAKAMTPDDPETAADLLRQSVRIITPIASSGAQKITGGIMAGGKVVEPLVVGRSHNLVALVQHEDLTLRHTSGQAKFLEIPFLAGVVTVPEAVMSALDAEAASEGAA